METSLDLTHWREKPRGITYRRWVIVSAGLRQLLATRFFRGTLVFAWTAGALIAALTFLFSQSVASGGWLETTAANFGPRAQAVATAFGALVALYPDICVDGLFTLLFWLQSFVGLTLSLTTLTVIIPRLIARDRATNALTIYLSRPITSIDYLLGKLGIVVGVLALVWTGPLLCGWALSLLLAPGRDFIVYSFSPLLRALLFNGLGLVVLASIALGVSALTRSSRNTMFLWIALWIIVGQAATSRNAPDWLRSASFSNDLYQMRQHIFRLDDKFANAAQNLPLLDQRLVQNLDRSGQNAAATNVNGALAGLGIMVALSSFAFLRRIRPE